LQSPFRQYDIPLANPQFYTIPDIAPGRIMTDDFVFFYWKANIDPSRYTVVVESLDIAGTTFRSIGPLKEQMKLPFVQFGPYAKIGVIPDSQMLPNFSAILARGATYLIPNVAGMNGTFQMERLGGKF
jgi:hypothetical protein